MARTVETPYAEAKRNKLYLPPIDEKTGAVIRDFYNDELHFPAGYVGSRPGKFVEQPDDNWKPYAHDPSTIARLTTLNPVVSNSTPVNQPLCQPHPDEKGCQPLVNLPTPAVESKGAAP